MACGQRRQQTVHVIVIVMVGHDNTFVSLQFGQRTRGANDAAPPSDKISRAASPKLSRTRLGMSITSSALSA